MKKLHNFRTSEHCYCVRNLPVRVLNFDIQYIMTKTKYRNKLEAEANIILKFSTVIPYIKLTGTSKQPRRTHSEISTNFIARLNGQRSYILIVTAYKPKKTSYGLHSLFDTSPILPT
jgi:hypothetical protein